MERKLVCETVSIQLMSQPPAAISPMQLSYVEQVRHTHKERILLSLCPFPAESVVALGDVRLLGDVDDVTGAVEYYDALLGWTGVCADSSHSAAWTTSNAASVVCSQLGYEGGRPFVESIDDVVTLSVINLDCSGDNVFTLADCQKESVVFSGGCSSQEAGWVECRKTGEWWNVFVFISKYT